MTVEITLSNDREAIVIADTRASSTDGRQSDSVTKIDTIEQNGKYHGIVCGTGTTSRIYAVTREFKRFQADSLETFVLASHDAIKKEAIQDMNQHVNARNEIVRIQEKAILGKKDKNKFRHKEEIQTLNDMSRYEHQMQSQVQIVAYNQQTESLEMYLVNDKYHKKGRTNILHIGSGADAAGVYFAAKLQGLNLKKLDLPQVAFFAMNGYAFANINQGVGGTPSIATVSKEGTRIIPSEVAIPLINLSGAYMAEIDSNAVANRNVTIQNVGHILAGKNIGKIAKELGMSKDRFTKTYVPYGSWQETANRGMVK